MVVPTTEVLMAQRVAGEVERFDWYEIDFSLVEGLGLSDAVVLCDRLDADPGVLGAALSGGDDGGHPFSAKAVERAAQALLGALEGVSIERLREVLPAGLDALYSRSAS